MARAKVLSAVSGKPGWYLVEDDLGVRYEVQSGVDGYEFQAGSEYRLFAPGGAYSPALFRLLPYKTSKRWRSAADTAKTHPATAAALFLYGDRMRELSPQDRAVTVQSVSPGRAVFAEGGSAKIAADEEAYYQPGDKVAVIHDNSSGNSACLKTIPGNGRVAGFSGKQTPRPKDPVAAALCQPLREFWNSYGMYADLINGGGEKKPENNTPGKFTFHKQNPLKNEVADWTARASANYVTAGQPYGSPAVISLANRLTIDAAQFSFTASSDPASPMYWPHLRTRYGLPMLLMYTIYPNSSGPFYGILSPPVVAHTKAARKIMCGGKTLKLRVNLLTEDTVGDYTQPVGSQIPACMVLVFDKAPYPNYIKEANINTDWHWYYPSGGGAYAPSSVRDTKTDQKFKLVYTAPPLGQDFGVARVPAPFAPGNGHFALRRPRPSTWTDPGNTRNCFNAPMDNPETGFQETGQLLLRCFDYNGNDVTPTNSASYRPEHYGYFPGYFEIPSNTDTTRNIYEDFLAAYPFMGNPAINAAGSAGLPVLGEMPRLETIYFYAQAKADYPPDIFSHAVPNPTRLQCKLLELFF